MARHTADSSSRSPRTPGSITSGLCGPVGARAGALAALTAGMPDRATSLTTPAGSWPIWVLRAVRTCAANLNSHILPKGWPAEAAARVRCPTARPSMRLSRPPEATIRAKRSMQLMRQSDQSAMHEVQTESVDIPGTQLRVSRVALGTWAMGGWMWGGTDKREAVATIRAALEQGINLIDTAPVYGFGVSEEIVGQAVAAAGLRAQAVIATKVGLEWRAGKVYRNATRGRIMREIDESLRRLRTDYIDIYQVHWPDPLVPSRRPARRCARSTTRGRFAPSASAISRWHRWSASARLRRCTCCSHPTTSSSEPSRRRFSPTAARTTSRRSPTP